MLLKVIEASNFMKYHRLLIGDLQDKAFIGIFGENESGKSTIGEIVSFALFGVTARYKGDELTQLINWDADECEVKLHFAIDEDQDYTVVRCLSREGQHKAILYRSNAKTPYRKGHAAVTNEIERLTDFNFQSFRYTFYLAQKEIDVILKDRKSNTNDLLYKMLGFDRIYQARESLCQERENLVIRKEKCESEQLVTQALIKDIKVDSAIERSMAKQLAEQNQVKEALLKESQKSESQVALAQELVALHQKLSHSFHVLERSFHYHFHKERLTLSLRTLSHIYASTREEKNRLKTVTQNYQQEWDKFQEQARHAEFFSKELEEIDLLVKAHHKYIQKRLVFPDKGSHTPPSNNLQVSLQSEERALHRIASWGVSLLIGAIGSLLLGGYCFLSALAVKINQKAIFFDWNSSDYVHLEFILWVFFIISLLLSMSLLAGIFSCRQQLKVRRKTRESIISEIERLQKEVDVCLGFRVNLMKSIKLAISKLSDPQILQQIETLEKNYAFFFENYTTLEQLEHSLRSEQERLQQKKQDVEKCYLKLESLNKLIESMVKDADFGMSPSKKEQDWLQDFDLLEKKIYQLVEEVQEHRTCLRDYTEEEPLEIDRAWQEYEQYRVRFRTLAEVSSMGGGTGMLNRLQLAFRQKDSTKLLDAFTVEKENFFSTLPMIGDLQTALDQQQQELATIQVKLNDGNNKLKELELKYHKCEEELAKKNDLLSKYNALGRKTSELDHSIQIHTIAIEMMEKTAESANSRFAPGIAKIMSRLLPRFTKGRYNHVQVENDLTVKAYSTEKSDFVYLSELSGGTVDQLFLSLRLAFSQAIMSARVGRNNRQFLFFDEPIISFDEQRSCSFLDLLADYNKNFVQIFVISPRPYQDDIFDLVINTDLAAHELVVSARNTARLRRCTKRMEKIVQETPAAEPVEKQQVPDTPADLPPPEEAIAEKAEPEPKPEPDKKAKETKKTARKRRRKKEDSQPPEKKEDDATENNDDISASEEAVDDIEIEYDENGN